MNAVPMQSGNLGTVSMIPSRQHTKKRPYDEHSEECKQLSADHYETIIIMIIIIIIFVLCL